MSTSSEEFAHYAEAERRLCDEAGPTFAEIVRGVEARTGLQIAEVRITFDRTTGTGELISANCTIVRAAPAAPAPPLDAHHTHEQRFASEHKAAE